MSSGEFLTRSTSWISIVAYAAGCVLFAAVRGRDLKWARLAWTIGCAALLTHFICAFQFYHAWSQTSAYIATARQTADVTGINWGGGLFINYAVATLWTADITWWWFAGVFDVALLFDLHYLQRNCRLQRWIDALVRYCGVLEPLSNGSLTIDHSRHST